EKSYSFWLINKKRRFKILAGSGEFMARHQDDLPQITGYQLVQNYPNPFNNSTIITIELKENTHVHLAIYNLLAQHVRTLYDGPAKRGMHQFHWNAIDNNGRDLGAGIYILRLETPSYSATRKMIYMR
ncbi:T9SS type A sorting domain-containing protein, partial [candidate division KSB1 bacterium]|nr:T9SS type A sorting domain-containing protein [candidate division KSB1 bacterium]